MVITDKQREVLAFIRHYLHEFGYSPKLIEIAAAINIKSKGVAHRYVQALIKAGYLERTPEKARGIQLVEKDSVAENSLSKLSLPLVGMIAAGEPIEAIPDQEETDITAMLFAEGRYTLKVKGDSMINAGILDGDTVVIESSNVARNGQIVVALVDNESATLKTIQYGKNKTVQLIPENDAYSPMVYPQHRVQIQGILVGQLRCY